MNWIFIFDPVSIRTKSVHNHIVQLFEDSIQLII